ncbi:hypothetical protein RN001_004827, partial [Aquatica leii]
TEDEGNHGNDDTRCFILSTLASQGRSKVHCVLCEDQMLVFDRYPLVDGTFFLSPRQHAKSCIEVKVEGRTQFLTAVCMSCLEGAPGRGIRCRFCCQQWDGSSLVLGTMYSYDIFAAMPCCTERIKCNACFKPVLHPTQRLNFFSDYSHMIEDLTVPEDPHNPEDFTSPPPPKKFSKLQRVCFIVGELTKLSEKLTNVPNESEYEIFGRSVAAQLITLSHLNAI